LTSTNLTPPFTEDIEIVRKCLPIGIGIVKNVDILPFFFQDTAKIPAGWLGVGLGEGLTRWSGSSKLPALSLLE
jgi:hypothetical protein